MAESVPLSWKEARTRLIELLQKYVSDPPPPRRDVSIGDEGILISWIQKDLDIYAGALCVVALFVLSSLAFAGHIRASMTRGVYLSQIWAAIFLAIASSLSLWMVRRRTYQRANDTDASQRREILRYLRAVEKFDKSDNQTQQSQAVRHEAVGNSLNDDVFPVYRRDEEGLCHWTGVPSLLLVRGDYIALQLGDLAPANVVMIENGERTSLQLVPGECFTLGASSQSEIEEAMKTLPKGCTTISDKSSDILKLCNQKRIFLILETPLESFIYRRCVVSKPSKVSRNLTSLRKLMFVLGCLLMVLTAVILYPRYISSSSDLSLYIHIPLMQALAAFPVILPSFFFLLEALGTARILVGIHPYATSTDPTIDAPTLFPESRLLLRYLMATCLSRLSLWEVYDTYVAQLFPKTGQSERKVKLVKIPPASLNLLEKLGVATAFTLVDDALACEPSSIPQQLLIPSNNGLKLLDICPMYDEDSDSDSHSASYRRQGKSFDSDSEESDDGNYAQRVLKRKILRPKRIFRRPKQPKVSDEDSVSSCDSDVEVQFEDPNWWQYLPSLKGVGLSCLAINDFTCNSTAEEPSIQPSVTQSLVNYVCRKKKSEQLDYLAACIGFSCDANTNGPRGDLSPFTELSRLSILSSRLATERMLLDTHERSSIESRWWGLLRPDSTSVVLRDARNQKSQLLTVGDPSVVVDLCQEAWQGEMSTILPLGNVERQTILDTSKKWKLADLDVVAFGYAPSGNQNTGVQPSKSQYFLLDHQVSQTNQIGRVKTQSSEWGLVRNQILLGVLGSVVVPRREIQGLSASLSEAGVRFVYFSPRNMRRQKELASQMGIDVAWNCAISLRPLTLGDEDPYRMKSNYADWDVNAKLPHGVDDVKRHLEEVDNVPLLVSLFTDSTKKTTQQMVEVFQDYHDTVVSVGVSHLGRNDGIFALSDIAIGVDTMLPVDKACDQIGTPRLSDSFLLAAEINFASSIASRSCAFRLREVRLIGHLSSIIEEGRAAFDAAVAASIFVLYGFVTYAMYVLFAVCTPSVVIPFLSTFGSVCFLQITLPFLGFSIAMGRGDVDIMSRVPAKNDAASVHARKQQRQACLAIVLKALPPAILPQLLHMPVFGELILALDPDEVEQHCAGSNHWVQIVRCHGLREYTGHARVIAGVLTLLTMVLCVTVSSAGFLSKLELLQQQNPVKRNAVWCFTVTILIAMVTLYFVLSVHTELSALSWYIHVLTGTLPFFCLAWVELVKMAERKLEIRLEKLRRLQFETRLGAWSPK